MKSWFFWKHHKGWLSAHLFTHRNIRTAQIYNHTEKCFNIVLINMQQPIYVSIVTNQLCEYHALKLCSWHKWFWVSSLCFWWCIFMIKHSKCWTTHQHVATFNIPIFSTWLNLLPKYKVCIWWKHGEILWLTILNYG